MASAKIVKPEVLIMGSSRAMQVRRFFFNDDITMYNAGYVTSNPVDMLDYLKLQDNEQLHTVILGLDQYYLINASFNLYNNPDVYTIDTYGVAATPVSDAKFFLSKMLAEPHAIPRLFDDSFLGYNAVLNETGFIKDGSFFYGNLGRINHDSDGPRDIQSFIEAGIGNSSYWLHGDTVSEQALINLQALLEYCHENQLHVIAFFPPYAPSIYKAMKELGNWDYIWDAAALLPKVFDTYGFEFYDYSDVAFLGCTDKFFLDAFHGSDTAYLRMFIDMIEAGSHLGELCDLDSLKQYDANRYWDGLLLENLEAYWARQAK